LTITDGNTISEISYICLSKYRYPMSSDKNNKAKPLFDRSASTRGKYYFLGIGIDKYEHHDQLNNAVNDVEDIYTVLHEKYGFESTERGSIILKNEQATRENVINALSIMEDKDSISRILIYFSGHGKVKGNKGFWIPVDAAKDEQYKFISNGDVHSSIAEMNAKHVLLICDSCFAGAFVLKGDDTPFSEMSFDEMDMKNSRYVFCSGNNVPVSDGKPGTNSPFAAELKKKLMESELPMNIGYLADYITKAVTFKTNQFAVKSPIQTGKTDLGGEFVFFPINSAAIAWKNLDKTNLQAVIEFDQKHNTPESESLRKSLQDAADTQAHADEWDAVKQKHTAKDYLAFYNKYEKSIYRLENEQLMDECEDDEYWAKPTAQTLAGAREYTRKFPKGRHIKEARAILNPIHDPIDNEKIKSEEEEKRKREEEIKRMKEANAKDTAAFKSCRSKADYQAYLNNGYTLHTDKARTKINAPDSKPFVFLPWMKWASGGLVVALAFFVYLRQNPSIPNNKIDSDGDGIEDASDICPTDFYNKCKEPVPQPTPKPSDEDKAKVKALLQNTRAFIKAEEWELAKKELDEAKSIDPNHPDINDLYTQIK
jgi:Caspase domain